MRWYDWSVPDSYVAWSRKMLIGYINKQGIKT